MKVEGTAMGEKKKASYARRDEDKIVRRRGGCGGGNGRTTRFPKVPASSSSSSVMQRVFEVCRAIFKGPGTVPMPRDVLLLQLLLDEMKPEDAGLSTDLHFFKDRVAKGTPRITFTSIYNGDNFSMFIFFLPPTAVIPLHNHPGMTVFSKLLLGSMHIKSYDWVNNSEENKYALSAQLRLAKLVEDSDFTAPCKTAILYPTTGGNIHTFRAITGCAVLDILGPPYSTKDEHRDCTYYQDYPYSDFAGDGWTANNLGWLEEINIPKDLKMKGIKYLGPKIVDC